MARSNIYLTGMPGSGKTTVGALLADLLGMAFVDLDEMIESAQGERIFDIINTRGEAEFRALEAAALSRLEDNNLIVSTGGGAVVRKENIEKMKATGVIVFLDAPLERLLTADTAGRPLLGEEGAIERLYKERIDIYRSTCDISIENSALPQDAAERIAALVRALGEDATQL